MNFADILLRIAPAGEDETKRALKEVAAEVIALNKEEARVRIKADGGKAALAQMAEIDAALTLLGKRSASVEVKVETKAAQAALKDLGLELQHALSGGKGGRPLDAILGDFGALSQAIPLIGQAKKPLLDLTAGANTTKEALRGVATQLIGLGGSQSKASVATDGGAAAKGALDGLIKSLALAKSGGSGRAEIKVDADISKAETKLKTLGRELEHALSGGIGRPAAAILSDIGSVGDSVAKLATEGVTGFAKFAEGFQGVAADVSQGAVKLGSSLASSLIGGLATLATTAIAAVGAVVLLEPVLLALIGVIGALVASLAAAAAGFGAVLVAGVAAFIPVVLVAVLALKELVGAVQALSQQQQNAKQFALQLAAAQHAVAQSSQQQLLAVQNLAQATIDAHRAERDAVVNLTDAELGLEAAKLGVDGANLSLEKAQLNLKQVLLTAKGAGPALADLFKKFQNVDLAQNPKDLAALLAKTGVQGTQAQINIKQALLDVATAQLGVKQAKEGDVKATNALSDAQATNNRFARLGISAYQPYTAAVRAVADANYNLAQSEQNVSNLRAQNIAQTKKYSESTLDLAGRVIAFGKVIKTLLEPALAPINRGIGVLLDGFTKLFKDPQLRRAMGDIGKAIGGVVASFGRLLARPEVRSIFASVAEGAAKLVRVIGGPIFQSLFLILSRIAKDAGPPLLALFRRFASFLSSIERGTRNAKSLQGGITGVIRSFLEWLGLIRSFGALLLAFFRGAKNGGDSLVVSITRLFDRWAKFLGTKKGQEEIKQFITESIAKVKHFGEVLGQIFNTVSTIVTVFSKVFDVVSKIAGLVGSALFAPILDLIKFAKDPGSIKPLSIVKSVVHSIPVLGGAAAALGFADGGLIPGAGGRGDDQLRPVEGGEYVIKRAVVRSIGLPALDAINNGSPSSAARHLGGGGSGLTIENQQVILPAAPGHDRMGDANTQAALFAKEMRRRGKGRGV